jgi:RNA polymerase sigma-70 factor (ECF subfamily)
MTLALTEALEPPLDSGVELTEQAWGVLYDTHFDFVWRSLRRLGVPLAALDDAAQEVFLIALRRRDEFEGRSAIKTWLFGIAWNIARSVSRAPTQREEALPEAVADARELGPQEAALRSEAVRTLYELLDELGAERRAVFVMAELEEMSAPEIAEIVGAPVNTVYSRLRGARSDFNAALRRRRARDDWRGR